MPAIQQELLFFHADFSGGGLASGPSASGGDMPFPVAGTHPNQPTGTTSARGAVVRSSSGQRRFPFPEWAGLGSPCSPEDLPGQTPGPAE